MKLGSQTAKNKSFEKIKQILDIWLISLECKKKGTRFFLSFTISAGGSFTLLIFIIFYLNNWLSLLRLFFFIWWRPISVNWETTQSFCFWIRHRIIHRLTVGLLTTLVVATCRCRKMSSDTTAFDMSKCLATFSKYVVKMSM